MVARVVLTVALVIISACGGDDGSPAADASRAVDARRTCDELEAAWIAAIAAIDTSCTPDAGCQVMGAHVGPPSCNCTPWLAPVAGRNARAELGALSDEYAATCGDVVVGSVCDAGEVTATCVDGRCQLEQASCLDPG
jgi:hypothetical protein